MKAPLGKTRPVDANVNRGADLRQRTESANRLQHAQTQADQIAMTKHRIYTTSFASVYPH
jgi:hypothetical protein